MERKDSNKKNEYFSKHLFRNNFRKSQKNRMSSFVEEREKRVIILKNKIGIKNNDDLINHALLLLERIVEQENTKESILVVINDQDNQYRQIILLPFLVS